MKTPAEQFDEVMFAPCECVKCGVSVVAGTHDTNFYCPLCNVSMFAMETRLKNVLASPDTTKELRLYIRKWLRKGWTKCEKCKRHVKNIGKHMARRHPTGMQSELETHAIETKLVDGSEDLFA